jgi:hypothetical protein
MTGSGGFGESPVQGTSTSGSDEVTSESNKVKRSRSWNVSVWVTIILALSMVWIVVSLLFWFLWSVAQVVTFLAFHGIVFVLSVIIPWVIPHQQRYINKRLFSLLLKLYGKPTINSEHFPANPGSWTSWLCHLWRLTQIQEGWRYHQTCLGPRCCRSNWMYVYAFVYDIWHS